MTEFFNDFFDRVIYINCDHREDRRIQIQSVFESIGFPMNKLKRFPATYIPENGIRGCAQSHINVLNYMIRNPEWDRVLIIEDDFYFESLEGIKYLEHFYDKIDYWDVLMLGFNRDTMNYIKEDDHIIRILSAYSGIAYCPQRQYLKKLRDCLQNNCLNRPKNYEFALDVQWNKLQKEDLWYGITPRIAWQKNMYSDIEKRNVNYSNL